MRSGSGNVGEVVNAGLAGFAMNLLLGSQSDCVFPSSGCLLRTEVVCVGSRATRLYSEAKGPQGDSYARAVLAFLLRVQKEEELVHGWGTGFVLNSRLGLWEISLAVSVLSYKCI